MSSAQNPARAVITELREIVKDGPTVKAGFGHLKGRALTAHLNAMQEGYTCACRIEKFREPVSR